MASPGEPEPREAPGPSHGGGAQSPSPSLVPRPPSHPSRREVASLRFRSRALSDVVADIRARPRMKRRPGVCPALRWRPWQAWLAQAGEARRGSSFAGSALCIGANRRHSGGTARSRGPKVSHRLSTRHMACRPPPRRELQASFFFFSFPRRAPTPFARGVCGVVMERFGRLERLE